MNNGYVTALEARHAQTDARLHEEMTRPLPDATACADLKKRKLALKDELVRGKA